MKPQYFFLVFVLLWWVLFINGVFFPVNSSAQMLGKPENLGNVWGIEGNNCTFRWNIVPGATGYRIDVASDSLFTDILPGLKNIPILRHRILLRTYPPGIFTFPPTTNATSATIWGLPFSGQYYCRVRAENGALAGENSTTLTIKTLPRGCIASEISSVSDSSLDLRWRIVRNFEYANNVYNVGCAEGVNANSTYNIRYHPTVEANFCSLGGPFRSPNENGVDTASIVQIQTQGSFLTLKNLTPNTSYSISIVAPSGSVGGICGIATLPKLYASSGRMISFYEGPLPYKIPDSSAYYSRNDTLTTLENALNLVQRARSMGIAVDTMWFHRSVIPILIGRIFVPLADGNIDARLSRPQVCGFTVKLRQKDDRMLSLGFANRIGFWEYADNLALAFYRYVFSGTTSVQTPSFSLNSSIVIAPNPASEQTILYYSLPKASSTIVEVYSLLGHRVYLQNIGYQTEGTHAIPLNIENLPNGMYRVCLRIVDGSSSRVAATQALSIIR